jgi:hypothetical protein
LEDFHASFSLRHQARLGNSISPQEALDDPQHRGILILGDPGSGKSSLLHWLMRDIMQTPWRNRRIPIFVSLREYWETFSELESKYQNNQLSLVDYALKQAWMLSQTDDDFSSECENLLHIYLGASDSPGLNSFVSSIKKQWKASQGQVLFLLDGMDEISGDGVALALITSQIGKLRQTSPAFSWVLTSRRTGFFGGIFEDIRYEIADLDQEGSAKLIGNWFQTKGLEFIDGKSWEVASQDLSREIFTNPRLALMASNPFLLTLLCYLRQTSGHTLPLNRGEVYRQLLAAILNQFNLWLKKQTSCQDLQELRHFSSSRFDNLAAFCFHLYTEAPNAPVNLFDCDLWERFFQKTNLGGALLQVSDNNIPALEWPYLKSRLLDQWGDQRSGYHLVHLTFHEYLIAHDLIEKKVHPKWLLRFRYAPHWREPIRFYGALLWQLGEHKKFHDLTDGMLEKIDLAGILYIVVARMLLEVDFVAFSRHHSIDFRGKLWEVWLRDEPYVSDRAGEALALLDSDYVFQQTSELILSYQQHGQSQPFDHQASYLKGESESISQDPAVRAVALLGTVNHPRAHNLLFDLFKTDWDTLSVMAVDTLSLLDDTTLHKAIENFVSADPENKSLQDRFVALARLSARPRFLHRVLAYVTRCDDPDELLKLLAALVTTVLPEAVDVLTSKYASWPPDADKQIPHLIITTLGCCGGQKALLWFQEQLDLASSNESRQRLLISGIESGLTTDDELLLLLQNGNDDPILLSKGC